MKYNFYKRLFDLFFATITILFFSPFLIIIILILLLTGEQEVFYLQERVGRYSKPFKIWKFATMVKNSPNLGTGDVTMRNDPRVLPFGKLLRISKINEIPQLINIIIGDMSIVGPRPLMKEGYDRYDEEIKSKIYNIKPGLTGIGSIIFRDEEKIITNSKLKPHQCYKEVILPYKGEIELWYQKNQNFFVDTKIIFCTIWVVLFKNSKIHRKLFKSLPKGKFF